MTVIAFRDGVLAADRRVTDGHGRQTGEVDKIGRHLGFRWAWCGDHGNAKRLLDWILSGGDGPQPKAKSGSVVVIPDEGQAIIYGQGTSWPVPDAEFHAWGSGSCYALGAMAMGAGAVDACLAACRFDTDCGGPIQTQD